MRWLTDPSKEDSQKIFKVLTGKDTDPSIFEKEKKKETAVKSSAAATVSKKKSADYPAVKMTISSPPPLPPIQQLAPLSESPQVSHLFKKRGFDLESHVLSLFFAAQYVQEAQKRGETEESFFSNHDSKRSD